MFDERFEGSAVHGSARQRLSFESRITKANAIKDEWAFIWDDPLRYNIAYALQDVQFGVFLVNHYNVYWALEAMVFKHAIVQIASVAEAVLQYDLKMIEDDPRVLAVLGKEWVWVDYKHVPLPGVELADNQRAVTGLQRAVEKTQLDRNSKMEMLIRAAKKAELIDESLAGELDEIRKLRNRIHIKTLDEPECAAYTAKMANDALDTLERYRQSALKWTAARRQPGLDALVDNLRAQTTQAARADDDIPF